MLPELHVSMTPCCDVEIPLYFVPFQAAVYSACLLVTVPPSFRSLLEFAFSLLLQNFSDYMFRMGVFLLISLSRQVSTIENMQTFVVYPVIPTRAIFGKSISRQDAIA